MPIFTCATLAVISLALAHGDGTFEAPLIIPAGAGPPAVSIVAGRFDGDDRFDLATVNGTGAITVLTQDPVSRDRWTPRPPFTVGNVSFSLAAADFDGDGRDDLLVADPGTIAYYLRSKGDGTFEKPVDLDRSVYPREFAIGDWNGDRKLDLATADLNGVSVTVYLGGGNGSFAYQATYSMPGFPHAIEALDFDGDGFTDLNAKLKETGNQPLRSQGDGRFQALGLVTNLGPRGDIASGDFNGDGKGDLLTNFGVGISRGDGTFENRLDFERPFRPVEAADLTSDGKLDAVVANEGTSVDVHAGKGDGTFLPAVTVPLTGRALDLLVRDLDGDGRADLVAGLENPAALAILWGREGSPFLSTTVRVEGLSSIRSVGVGDFDREGTPDLIVPSGNEARIRVYLQPGTSGLTTPPRVIITQNVYTYLEPADLDGDGILDFAGANSKEGKVLVALLGAEGSVRGEAAIPAGVLPYAPLVARIDSGAEVDLVVPCYGSNHLAVFSGQGAGGFSGATSVPTVENPKEVAAGDLDRDGFLDLAVAGEREPAVHYGGAGGELSGPIRLRLDVVRILAGIAIADLDGDGLPDVTVLSASSSGVVRYRGKAGREFESPETIVLADRPASLLPADLEGNGFPDLTIASSGGQKAVVLLNRGERGFPEAVGYPLGFSPLGHRLADLDLDGALDLVAYNSSIASILFGRSSAAPRFLRGDADGEGHLDITDVIRVIDRAFLGGPALACEDAADSNDDGTLDLSDPIALLGRLFLGEPPLPLPGPGCGPDPTADGLAECGGSC